MGALGTASDEQAEIVNTRAAALIQPAQQHLAQEIVAGNSLGVTDLEGFAGIEGKHHLDTRAELLEANGRQGNAILLDADIPRIQGMHEIFVGIVHIQIEMDAGESVGREISQGCTGLNLGLGRDGGEKERPPKPEQPAQSFRHVIPKDPV